MKVLITGSKGQLGIALNKLLSKRNDIEIVDTDIDDMDITNIEDVRKVLNKYNPNYVINCAAYTKVDECETHQDLAFKVNLMEQKKRHITKMIKQIHNLFMENQKKQEKIML